jgi:plasmid stabilization system protein ParE
VAYKIFFTEDSLTDLENILDYIGSDNEAAAESFGVALLDHIKILQDFPRIGTPIRKRAHVRKLLHSPVRIYYRLHEDRRLVEILHFWHGARRDPRI